MFKHNFPVGQTVYQMIVYRIAYWRKSGVKPTKDALEQQQL